MPQVVPAQKRAQDPRRVLANLFFACQMIPLAVGTGRDEVPWPPSCVFLGKEQDQGGGCDLGGDGEQQEGGGMRPAAE